MIVVKYLYELNVLRKNKSNKYDDVNCVVGCKEM